MLQKWEIVRVWRADLRQPHDKFCICLDWVSRSFLYINSEPPQFRKAQESAVMVTNFEVQCLNKPESYIDTTAIIDDLPEVELQEAVADQDRRHGSIAPFVRERIREAAASNGALTDDERAAILD